MQEFKKLNSY